MALAYTAECFSCLLGYRKSANHVEVKLLNYFSPIMNAVGVKFDRNMFLLVDSPMEKSTIKKQ